MIRIVGLLAVNLQPKLVNAYRATRKKPTALLRNNMASR